MFKSVSILKYNSFIFLLSIFLLNACQEDLMLVQKISISNNGSGSLTASMSHIGQDNVTSSRDFNFLPEENKTIIFGFQCAGKCKDNKNWKFEIDLYREKDQCFYKIIAESECGCRSSTLDLNCDDNGCTVDGQLAGKGAEHRLCIY